jgi:lysozyme
VDRTRLQQELIRDEGKKLESYKDTRGYWTIGVGHLLGKDQRMLRITEEECNALLYVDIAEAESIARGCIPLFDKLNDARQRALVNMALNRGNHMKTSTTITPAINAAAAGLGPWSAVTKAINGSQWATQVGLRAIRLAGVLETGVA